MTRTINMLLTGLLLFVTPWIARRLEQHWAQNRRVDCMGAT